MAASRLALVNLHKFSVSSSSYNRVSGPNLRIAAGLWRNKAPIRLMATAEEGKSEGDNNQVGGVSKRSKLFPRLRRYRRGPWRASDYDLLPSIYDAELSPSSLGNALLQATENMNRLFESLELRPWQLTARVKEEDDHYKLRYDVPGLSKDDVKITVDDGVLVIKGERKEEEEKGGDDKNEYWAAKSYGYYNARVALPEDAKVDEIRAEIKDGVLTVTVPRMEKAKKDVREITID